MNLDKLETILRESASHHDHLCPRQILGARLGLRGLTALGFEEPPGQKRLIVITETDGCFVDGLIAATACTVGHRTLRVEDFGKTAATFVDTQMERVIRVAPVLDVREKVHICVPDESRHYFAQLQAYRIIPDDEMFTVTPVGLKISIEAIVSSPGLRVTCEACGEEIMNEREVTRDGLILCCGCAEQSYYSTLPKSDREISHILKESLA